MDLACILCSLYYFGRFKNPRLTDWIIELENSGAQLHGRPAAPVHCVNTSTEETGCSPRARCRYLLARRTTELFNCLSLNAQVPTGLLGTVLGEERGGEGWLILICADRWRRLKPRSVSRLLCDAQ